MPLVHQTIMKLLSSTGIKRIWYWKKLLEKEERLAPDQIHPIINERASALVESLKENMFYKQMFPKGPGYQDNPQDLLKQFPILTKEIIRSNLRNGLLNDETGSRMRIDSTSGSTGVPLQFAKDMDAENVKLATEIMFSEYTGWRFGEKQAYLWAEHKESNAAKIWKRYFLRLKQFPPYLSSDSDAQQQLSQIKKWNPRLLTGYSSALFSFAQYFEDTVLIDGLKGIIASAESLYAYQKKVVEEKFNAPVFMRYGSRELDNISMECSERNGYHILQSRYIVEILDDNGIPVEEEKIGHIVVTDLMNHVMPFVRYDTGDEGSITYTPCSCGRTSPRFMQIMGRTCDYILLPSETKVPALRFNVLFEQMGNIIHEFQIVQETATTIRLRVVPGRLFSSEWNEERMKELVKSLLSHELEVIIEIVDSIPRTKVGKLRPIIPLK